MRNVKQIFGESVMPHFLLVTCGIPQGCRKKSYNGKLNFSQSVPRRAGSFTSISKDVGHSLKR